MSSKENKDMKLAHETFKIRLENIDETSLTSLTGPMTVEQIKNAVKAMKKELINEQGKK